MRPQNTAQHTSAIINSVLDGVLEPTTRTGGQA